MAEHEKAQDRGEEFWHSGKVTRRRLIGWSAACAVGYLQGFGRCASWVVAEVVVVAALILSTEVVASDQWALDNQSWPTTLWATNATISMTFASV